jgi:hypothetical protein
MFPDAEITAVEEDPETASSLAHNMANLALILGAESVKPIRVVVGSCLRFLLPARPPRHKYDAVYFDPPWGGPKYYCASHLELKLGGRPLGAVVGDILALGVAPLVVIKVPALPAELGGLKADIRGLAGGEVALSSHDIVKPRETKKGHIWFRLVFVRRAGPA